MGSGLHCDQAPRYLSERLLHRFRCRQHFLFQNDFACFIQNTVERPAISQIHTNRQLLRIAKFVVKCQYSANLLHSRSPFSCASSTSIIGSVSHPLETGLLIPSDLSGNRTSPVPETTWTIPRLVHRALLAMKSFLASQVIARQNACRNRGECFGSQVANANRTLDRLRWFHPRLVLVLFYDSDDEACSAPCFFASFRRLRCWCRLRNYGRFRDAEEVVCSFS